MAVKVRLGIFLAACAKNYLGSQPVTSIQVNETISIVKIADLLGIPLKYIGFSTINGERANINDPVCDGDEVILFPYVTGG